MLDFIIALITSALAGTGVGGGGLLVIYLTLVKDMEQLKAQGINIAFFIAGAVASLLIHIRKRHLNFPLMLLIGVLGASGSVLGSVLAEKIAPSFRRRSASCWRQAGSKPFLQRSKNSYNSDGKLFHA